MSGLKDVLCNTPYAYDFFSAVALLEEFYRRTEGVADPLAAGRIRFSAHPSTAFPSADMAGCRVEPDGAVRLVPAFMGLVGVMSPLPHYFSEHAFQAEENGGPLREFLDIFGHRLYSLFYQAWRLCHPAAMPAADHPIVRVLAALVGIEPDQQDSPSNRFLLGYAGLLAGGPRSADGLAEALSDLFGGIPVSVQQCVGRWLPLPESPAVGRDTRLGDNAVLGDFYWDTAGAFRVIVGPLGRGDYDRFFSVSDTPRRMAEFIQAYLPNRLDFEIRVLVTAGDLTPATLGEHGARLGMTACLGRPLRTEQTHATVAADCGFTRLPQKSFSRL